MLGLLVLLAAAVAEPVNPYLAASHYPLPHGTPAQQDTTPVPGPTHAPPGLDYAHLGPGHFGASISGPYPDGRRVLWSNGLNGVVKQDHDSFKVLSQLAPAGAKHYDEATADAAIARFDARNEGPLALVAAFRGARMLRDLSGVYTMVDRDNRFYVGHKSGAILAYGDDGMPESPIALKGRYDFPGNITGNLIGINMTYDGWIVTATEHGHVVLVSRDLARGHSIRLKHSEIAEDFSGRPGYGWLRNSMAVDDAGGIYLASRDHLHKVVWTGERLSTDEQDGAWTLAYANGAGEGTGATPTLMGFGGENRFVVITDGDARMNLLLAWRDAIPPDWRGLPGRDRRVAAIAPVQLGAAHGCASAAGAGCAGAAAVQSEQSVVVGGYGALVVNNEPRNVPWYLPQQAKPLLISYLGSNPRHQPRGVQKFEWDPAARKLRSAWVDRELSSPNSVPLLSTGSGLVYLVGARDNQWTLEALDWSTGASRFHRILGGQRYNSFFAGTLIDEAGRVFYGTTWGRVRLGATR